MSRTGQSVITPAALAGGALAVAAAFVPARAGDDTLFSLMLETPGTFWYLGLFLGLGVLALVLETTHRGTRGRHVVWALALAGLWAGSASRWFSASIELGRLAASDVLIFAAVVAFLVALKTRPVARR